MNHHAGIARDVLGRAGVIGFSEKAGKIREQDTELGRSDESRIRGR